jgi:hypothetical protein
LLSVFGILATAVITTITIGDDTIYVTPDNHTLELVPLPVEKGQPTTIVLQISEFLPEQARVNIAKMSSAGRTIFPNCSNSWHRTCEFVIELEDEKNVVIMAEVHSGIENHPPITIYQSIEYDGENGNMLAIVGMEFLPHEMIHNNNANI